ncbi:MAG: hypothetical protein Q7U97_14245 [Rhodocyclaceae bacterium]|nr:hypothetical protein [Rhodocyclaceae bacterium]
MIFVAGILFGAVVGASLAWHRFCRAERPKIVIKVTPEFAALITRASAEEWARVRGLVWMPKGPDFGPSKVKQ